MLTFDHALADLVLRLHAAGVVKIDTEKGFKLKLHETKPDAPPSPIFLNIRTPSNPKPGPLADELVDLIGALLWRHAKEKLIAFDAVAGLPNAGIPLAEAFAKAAQKDEWTISIIKLGKVEIGAGMRKVEGVIDTGGVSPGKTVLLIDDLITEGHTKQEGIDALRVKGYTVLDTLVVVDRQQGGTEYLKQKKIQLWYLLTLPKIVIFLAKEGKITQQEQFLVLQYLGAQV